MKSNYNFLADVKYSLFEDVEVLLLAGRYREVSSIVFLILVESKFNLF